MRNGRDFLGRYSGFKNGQPIELTITETRLGKGSALRLSLKLNNSIYSGSHSYYNLSTRKSHSLSGVLLKSTNNDNVSLDALLHLWDSNYLTATIDNEGAFFSKEAINQTSNPKPYEGKDDWLGTFRGSWNGKDAVLKISPQGNQLNISVEDIESNKKFTSTISSSLLFPETKDAHTPISVRLRNGAESISIKNMFMHKRNAGLISGSFISENVEFGFYFIRE